MLGRQSTILPAVMKDIRKRVVEWDKPVEPRRPIEEEVKLKLRRGSIMGIQIPEAVSEKENGSLFMRGNSIIKKEPSNKNL